MAHCTHLDGMFFALSFVHFVDLREAGLNCSGTSVVHSHPQVLMGGDCPSAGSRYNTVGTSSNGVVSYRGGTGVVHLYLRVDGG